MKFRYLDWRFRFFAWIRFPFMSTVLVDIQIFLRHPFRFCVKLRS